MKSPDPRHRVPHCRGCDRQNGRRPERLPDRRAPRGLRRHAWLCNADGSRLNRDFCSAGLFRTSEILRRWRTLRPVPSDPWLAIDVATRPATRAREVRRAWERFVGQGDVRAVRAPIADSWRRSAAAGVDPHDPRIAPIAADADEASARWDAHPLAVMAPLMRECLGVTAEDSGCLVAVSDADGVLLWVAGNERVRFRAAELINFAEGALWSEAGAGTNAIGTALAAAHAVQVFAAEHFNEAVQRWTCAAAPVRDPDSGSVIGVVNLTGEMATVHPHSMAVATATAQAVETELRLRMHDRDSRLSSLFDARGAADRSSRALVTSSGRVIASRPSEWLGDVRLQIPLGGGEVTLPGGVPGLAEPVRYEDVYVVRAVGAARRGTGGGVLSVRLLGRDRAEVEFRGRRFALRQRQSELIALLCAHPEGLGSDELSGALYGQGGNPGSVRVEISRLRKLLGHCIETERYRLTCGVSSDVARVYGLLSRGSIRDAAAQYAGPLLPRSTAPGIVRERDALEAWMRKAVMSAGDQEALWAWLQAPTGTRDLAGWQRLLATLGFSDPRRSLAAARVAQLRGESDRHALPLAAAM